MLKHRLSASAAALAIASAQVTPVLALSPSQIIQQNTNPIPNPDGYSADRLLHMPAPTLGAGTTLGNDLVAGQSFVSTAIATLKTYVLALLQQDYTLQVPSAAALRTTAVFTGVLAHRGGYATAGDGGGASYYGSATACTSDDGGTCLNAPGGSWNIDWASVGQIAPTYVFGAICDGAHVAADTRAFQLAVATGRTVYAPKLGGNCQINASVVFNAPGVHGQVLYGDGVSQTKITAPTAFSGNGLFDFESGEDGPVIRDLTIDYPNQPNTTSLTDKNTYPPQIYAYNTPRFKLQNLRLLRGYTTVDMRGNTGGAIVENVGYNCFGPGCILDDGSLDMQSFSKNECFPFALTGNQATAFFTQGVTCMAIGRADLIQISDSLFIAPGGIVMTNGNGSGPNGGNNPIPPYSPNVVITNTDFDSERAAIIATGGNIQCTGCFFSVVDTVSQLVSVSNAVVTLVNPFHSEGGYAGNNTNVHFYVGPGGLLNIQGGYFLLGSHDIPLVQVVSASGLAQAMFSGNYVQATPNVARSQPLLSTVGSASRLLAQGNVASDKGSGSGVFAQVGADNFNSISGNQAPGWSYTVAGAAMGNSLASTAGGGEYYGNR